MKCPRCGAWTEVLQTRTRQDGAKTRRYVCANEHRFTTLEQFKEQLILRHVPDRPNKSSED